MAAKPTYEELERRIQEHERVEEELRKNEERFRRFFDDDLTADFITDGEGTILEVNPAFLKTFGFEQKREILNQNILLLYPDPSERVFILSELAIKGKLEQYKTVRKRKDGTLITVNENIVATHDQKGGLAEVKGYIYDITKRRDAEEALKVALARAEEAKRVFDALMEHIPMGITIADAPDVRIRTVSRYGRELTGKPREQIEGISVELLSERWEVFCKDGITPAKNEELPLARAIQKSEIVREEEWVIGRGDGTKIPILCTAAPIRDKEGNITGGVVGWLDISERKKAEQSGVFEEVFRSAPTFLHVLRGPDFIFEFANEAYYQLVGRRNLIGRPAFEAMPEAVEGGYPERIARVMATGETFFGRELPVTLARNPDGPPEVRLIDLVYLPLFEPDGSCVRVLGHGTDVTDHVRARKKAEEALEASQRSLAAELYTAHHLHQLSVETTRSEGIDVLYEHILDTAVAILHSDFASIQMLYPERGNGGELRLLGSRGFSEEAARFWEWVRTDSKCSCGVALKTGQRCFTPDTWKCDFMEGSDDLEIYRKTGIRAVQTTPLFSRSGTILGMLSTHWRAPHELTDGDIRALDLLARQAADLIDYKQAEGQLRRSYDELEIRVRERTAELERKNRELQNFAFIASHDLNEPLRKIQTFGSLLADKSVARLSERERDYILRIMGSANRMQELLAALLNYSRIEMKGEEFRTTPLNDVVRNAISDMEVAIREAGAQVIVGQLPIVNGDPNQLRQLFQNLMGNAIKYRRNEVTAVIRIRGEENNGRCRILVEDNGIGFDEKYLDKIFEPFQRLHGKNEYSGTGIGLAISRKVVERHGGTITAKSTPGMGSTFLVTLPVNGGKR